MYADMRKKYEDKQEEILKRAGQQGGTYARDQLKTITENHVFRIRGICPDDPNLYVDRINRDHVDPIFTQTPNEEMMIGWNIAGIQTIMHNGILRIVIYTDGSTLYPLHDMACTSGWGVFVADGAEANQAQLLHAELQDNYRVELRAVAHTVSVAAAPVLIRVDNKAVVDGFLKLLDHTPINRDHPDIDLWDYIAALVEFLPKDHIAIEWIPAHLNDEGSE